MSSPQDQFLEILKTLLSEDNNVRNQAEKVYMNTKKQQPNQVIQALLHIGRSDGPIDLRNLAFVLIRRSLMVLSTEASFWQKLNPEIQSVIQKELLIALEQYVRWMNF
jgi:hypothetical protein